MDREQRRHALILAASRYGMVVFLAALCTYFGLATREHRFLSVDNLLNVANQVSINAVLALGMTFVIISAGIDLSVGSVAALVGILTAGTMTRGLGFHIGGYEVVLVPLLTSGAMIPLGVLVGLLVGGLMGALNGLFVVRFRVPPFIITLAMMLIARNLALIYDDQPVAPLPRAFEWVGMWGRIVGVPIPVFITALLALMAWVVLSRTVYGRQVYAVGGSAEAAHVSGVRVNRVLFGVYVICGLTAAVAGVLEASQSGAGDPNSGELWELNAIAAVVLGGTSLMGGRGTIPGTLLGALIIGVLSNGLRLMDVAPFTQGVVKGCVILFAVVLDRLTSD